MNEWPKPTNRPLPLLMYYQNVLFLSTFLILILEALVLFLGRWLPTRFFTFLWITMLLSYYFLKIKQEEKKKPWCLSPGKEQLDTMPGPVQVSCATSPLSGAHTFWWWFCCHLRAALWKCSLFFFRLVMTYTGMGFESHTNMPNSHC